MTYNPHIAGPHVIIRYAPKPWDRGQPLTRTVEVPTRYDEDQTRRWLYEKLLLKNGETIISFHLANAEVSHGDSEKRS